MFRRVFLLGFGFVMVCGVGGAAVVLYHRWRSACLLEEADAKALTSTCLHQFTQQKDSILPPNQWNWNLMTRTWLQEFQEPRGFTLMDSVGGTIAYSTGEMSTAWNPVVNDPGDRNPHWITLGTGERFWTALPSPETDPRFRLWIAFGPPDSFNQYLSQRGHSLGAEALVLLIAFLLFYRTLGTPTRFLMPLVVILQRSLERADTPLRIDSTSVPGEFAPLAKTLSLLLEARQQDYQEKIELYQKVDYFNHQKNHASSLFNHLQKLRMDEQSSVEKVQAALLEANREPTLILDQNRRILMMNESARRILALGGQTGAPLRHPDLEAILNQEMQQTTRGTTYRLSTADLLLGKTVNWRVRIISQVDWRESGQVQTIVVYLTQESPDTTSRDTRKDRNLFSWFGEALEESWSTGARPPHQLSEREILNTESLLRALANYQPCFTEASLLLTSLGATARTGEIPGAGAWSACGSPTIWKAFCAWLGSLLETMEGGKIEPLFQGPRERALRIEWHSHSPLPFNAWFVDGETPSIRFRHELLEQTLKRLQSSLIWHPTAPETVILKISARQEHSSEVSSHATPA